MGQLRPWTLGLSLHWEDSKAIYLQIADYLRQEIQKGRLLPNTALPGSRSLAEQLQVNRKTVVEAYEQLLAEGWLESRHKSGTFVSPQLPQKLADQGRVTRKAAANRSSVAATTVSPKLPVIAVSDGIPDVRLAPLDELSRAYRRIFNQKARWRLMGYSSELGNELLRENIAHMLSQYRGIPVQADEILITRGSQMALYLTALSLIKPGDVVLIENPGYAPAWQVLRQAGAQLIPIPVDDEGIQIEAVESVCRRTPVKALLTTPQHQFPTTVTLKADRRMALLELSHQYGFTLIEDDYDHEFHYGTKVPLPLASYTHGGPIIYISSLSKLIAPAVRIGFVTGPPAFIQAAAALRSIIDRQGDNVLEQAVAELMQAGEIQKHARRALNVYRQRHAQTHQFLQQYLADVLTYRVPEGGLAYWIRFNENRNIPELTRQLQQQGVSVINTDAFSYEGTGLNALRIGFASLTSPEMEQVLQVLQKTL